MCVLAVCVACSTDHSHARLVRNVDDSQGVLVKVEADFSTAISGVWTDVLDTLRVMGVTVGVETPGEPRFKWVADVDGMKTTWWYV